MQKILSTYLFVSRKLTYELLAQISEHGFSGLEVFCSRAHFDYGSKQEIQALKSALEANRITLSSLHAPTSKDMSATRESGTPLSICEIERVRRIEAMDEFKRAIDVSEELPFSRMVLHMGGSRETADPRKRDAAFSSLEHLVLHAHHAGVTLAVENTTSEMGDPVASVHLHDNHGDKDEHLPPYDGSIDWSAAIPLLKSSPSEDLPVVLELKEKFGADALSVTEQLAVARASFERLENAWSA